MLHGKTDRILLLLVICLVVLGIIFVFSSSYYRALRQGENSTYYLMAHLRRVLVAVGFFLLGLLIPYETIRRMLLPLLVLILLSLLMTVFAGRFQFGAKRSLLIASVGLQVSEFVRIWLVFFLANFFSAHPMTASTHRGLATILGISFVIIILVAIQPSISMAFICLATLVAMLIYGCAKLKFLLVTSTVSAAILGIFIRIFPHAQHRIATFVSEPTYQVRQSLIAIGSGGLFGKGPGAGLQKFLFLPGIHNDFIFAHIAEELGFIGCIVVFVFYWQIYLRGLSIAGNADDEFARLMVLGLNASLFIIFLVHVGVSVGLLPPTGIPLPFISFGGWSLAANLFAVGIILQASRRRNL
ncbi:MAG: FtsW/RodA/SpoVE family cell cycle protein [candidate division WOR-3 bacterium]|nr:MAG: FtsW/RodA/SpoVE family cell cycle protein [candidate division WOR-3 bacterium]